MSSYRILVVTEEPGLRKALTTLVRECGFEAFPAADSFDALRQIYHVNPQVIVSDAELVNYAGFAFLPFLRDRFPEIGVIALRNDKNLNQAGCGPLVADFLLSSNPLDPLLLADTLAGMLVRYPLSGHAEMHDLTGSGSVAGKPSNGEPGADSCSQCAKLRQNVARSRMHYLLSRAWDRLHPADDGASRRHVDAAISLQQAAADLQRHQRRFHRHIARSEPQPSSDAADCHAMAQARHA